MRTQVGKTSDKAYKGCFAAYMSMSCASAFPRCPAALAKHLQSSIVGLTWSCRHGSEREGLLFAWCARELRLAFRLRRALSGRCFASWWARAVVFAPVPPSPRRVRGVRTGVRLALRCDVRRTGAPGFGWTTLLGESCFGFRGVDFTFASIVAERFVVLCRSCQFVSVPPVCTQGWFGFLAVRA